MNGVIVGDLELIIKKAGLNASDVKSNISAIKHDFSNLSQSIGSNDLKFLISKLDLELLQFQNVVTKTEAYITTLKNVLMSYQYQSEELVKDLNNLTS